MNNHRSELQNFWLGFIVLVVVIGFFTIPTAYYLAPDVNEFVSSIPDTVRVYLVQRWGF
jgi:hypothetical protein